MTFTWDLESAYISYVTNYRIYYIASFPGTGSYGASRYYAASPSRVTRINSGETFTFITTVTSFTRYSQYIMWLRVDISIAPSYLYSEQIYEEFGECIVCILYNIYVYMYSYIIHVSCMASIFTVTCTYSTPVHIYNNYYLYDTNSIIQVPKLLLSSTSNCGINKHVLVSQ